VLSALALTAVVASPATAYGNGIGVQLLDVPVAARLDPRARLYVVDHLRPGAVIHRRILISSSSRRAQRVALYPAAARTARSAFLVATGRARNELSTFISVAPAGATIPAGGRLTAVVTIAVPRAAAPGERYGVIWAEVRSRAAIAATATAAAGDVVQVSRVGIRVYLSVGAGAAPAADFSIGPLTAGAARDGRPTVRATVHNTGGRALDLTGTLRLRSGPGGLRAGPFPASPGVTLAIGAAETLTVALDQRLPAGPWNAQVALRSGLLHRTRQTTITFPSRSSTGAPLLTVALVGGLALATGGLLAQRAVLRRGRA
jgi:hypothetical protein